MKLTPDMYAEHNGAFCPMCLSSNVIGQPMEITEQGAEQKVSCDDCDAKWVDLFKLTGYAGLEVVNGRTD